MISSCVGRSPLLPSKGVELCSLPLPHASPPPSPQPPASPSFPASSAWISTFTVSPQMGVLVGSEATEVTALGL